MHCILKQAKERNFSRLVRVVGNMQTVSLYIQDVVGLRLAGEGSFFLLIVWRWNYNSFLGVTVQLSFSVLLNI